MPDATPAASPAADPGWNWTTGPAAYTALPEDFYAPAAAAPAPDPRTVWLNRPLCAELGLDPDALNAATLVGVAPPAGTTPVAQAYAGHQFGNFTMLGDGRAMLLGTHTAPDGRAFDVALKGSGPTDFARGGDGLAPLGPVLREVIFGEALRGLGIPTTRALAAATTGRGVRRVDVEPGAVLTRVAAGHVRGGTFEYAARFVGPAGTRALADHAIDRFFSEAHDADHPYRAFFAAVCDRQAELIARWMAVGFVHGVMNTDNLAVSGETIDFGPCAFLDAYAPDACFSSIDRHGRYAYANQPGIAQWNLTRMAEALLPLLGPSRGQTPDEDPEPAVAWATEVLHGFAGRYAAAWGRRFAAKLGLRDVGEAGPAAPATDAGDVKLAEDLLGLMHAAGADFTLTFRGLADAVDAGPVLDHPDAAAWAERWRTMLRDGGVPSDEARRRIAAANPRFIARNHNVEAAIAAGVAGDLGPMDQLLSVLAEPFAEHAGSEGLALARPEGLPDHRTFCGT